MKKIVLIIGIITIVSIIGIILLTNKVQYTVKVSKVDEQSPDRILTVYNDKNEKVEVQRIEYTDGTLLCNGLNTTVHFGDIENVKTLIVVLKDKNSAKAKVVEEEVK